MKSELKVLLSLVSLVIIFLFLFYVADDLGFSADMDTDFILVMPGLAVCVVGMILLVSTKGTFALPSFMVIGIGVMYLFGTLDTMGMITTQLKSGLTIEQIQLWILVIFTLMGGIGTAATMKR